MVKQNQYYLILQCNICYLLLFILPRIKVCKIFIFMITSNFNYPEVEIYNDNFSVWIFMCVKALPLLKSNMLFLMYFTNEGTSHDILYVAFYTFNPAMESWIYNSQILVFKCTLKVSWQWPGHFFFLNMIENKAAKAKADTKRFWQFEKCAAYWPSTKWKDKVWKKIPQ